MRLTLLAPGLRQLLWLHFAAIGRRFARSLKTVRGVFYLCLVIFMYGVWVVPTIWAGFMGRGFAGTVESDSVALGLLVIAVISIMTDVRRAGLHFSPAEVDFLFPAPFQRRDLLLYRLAGQLVSVCALSLLFSIFLFAYVRSWLCAYVGVVLAMYFVTVLAIAINLLIQTIGIRAWNLARKLLVVALLLALATFIFQEIDHLAQQGWQGALSAFRSSLIGRILLAPFEVFTRIIAAPSLFRGLFIWGTAGLILNALLVWVVLTLDVNFFESAIASGRRRFERMERARKGQFWGSLAGARSARWTLPTFPRWGGTGPLAWRQLVAAVRGGPGMFLFSLLLGVTMCVPLLLLHFKNRGPDGLNPSAVLPMLTGPLVALSVFLLPQILRFDFRGDLEQMDALKALPMSASAVVLGQLVAPVLVASTCELILLSGLALLLRGSPLWLLVAAAALIPINVVLFGIENLLFLLYPQKSQPGGAGDFSLVGRQMVSMFLKLICLLGVALPAGLLAAVVWSTTDSLSAAIGVAWIVTATCGVVIVFLLENAYRKFDPSLDTGE